MPVGVGGGTTLAPRTIPSPNEADETRKTSLRSELVDVPIEEGKAKREMEACVWRRRTLLKDARSGTPNRSATIAIIPQISDP